MWLFESDESEMTLASRRRRLTEALKCQGVAGLQMLQSSTCSICLEVFDDPVVLRGAGNTYCRECITEALASRPRDPLTNTHIVMLSFGAPYR